ncbi:MAG: hypothetical protein HYX93_03235 [Chloroflexi bacterium]|nr:hypothetical protein [Chloroflexota bacterium]
MGYTNAISIILGYATANEGVIMDAGKLNGSGQVVHCDGKHWPTSLDVDRADEFRDQGQAEWLPTSGSSTAQGPSSRGWFNWTDHAWAEYKYRMEYLYEDPVGSGNWVLFFTGDLAAGTGRHAWNFLDVKTMEVVRNTFGTPANRWYVACATPLFYGYDVNGRWGTRTCSFIVWLD